MMGRREDRISELVSTAPPLSPDTVEQLRALLSPEAHPEPARPGVKDRESDDPKWIYVIGIIGSNDVKIGISSHTDKRLAQLQTSNPQELQILLTHPGTAKLEWDLHGRLEAFRTRGEWFNFGDQDATSLIYRELNLLAGTGDEDAVS